MVNTNTIANIVAGLALAVAGFFSQSVNSLNTRVNEISNTSAAVVAQTNGIEQRLTRIENKLDIALGGGKK